MVDTCIRYRIIKEFNDSRLTSESWNRLLKNGASDVIFMTWQWQKTWWDVFGRGELLLIVAEQNEKPVALVPLFAENGMIYLVGSGGSDHLDIIGNTDAVHLEDMLRLASEQVDEFAGFVFYHLPEDSNTKFILVEAAKRLNWDCYKEGEMASPFMQLKQNREKTYLATRKKSLLRHEAWFKKNGELKTEHQTSAEDVLQHLDTFFQQHIERWEQTTFPSLFLDPKQKLFYKKLTVALADAGWLRFTNIKWQETSIACHFGFNYEGCFFWYKPSFDITFAKRSPGEVLLRQLLLQALEEEAHTFDFGLGDEPFKKRFATNSQYVENWGLYPKK